MATLKKPSAKTNSHGAKTIVPAGTGRKKSPQIKKNGSKTVAVRAYEIYCERKKKGIRGDSQSDWLRAEKEILGK